MRGPTWITSLGCAVAVLSTVSGQSAAATAAARVLVIYPETVQVPGIVDMDRGLRDALASGMSVPPRVYNEYLDSRRFPGIANDEELRRWFAHKYRDDRPDLIVSVSALPISVVAQPGREIWPGIPIVFLGLDHSELDHLKLPPESTGITFRWPVAQTIALVQQLLPRVNQLIVPSGADTFDRGYHDVFRQAVGQDEGIKYVEWTDASISQMRERLEHAPEDAAVFATVVNGDREMPSMTPLEVSQTLAAASSRPVFGMIRTHLGTGMVGGWLLDPEVVGYRGGELAVRVLRGSSASSIPVELSEDIFRPVFDARALRRFDISRTVLPAGSEILFDDVSVLTRYRWQILTGIGLLLLQTGLIAVLLEQRRRRQSAEADAETSDAVNAALVASMASQAAVVDPDGMISWISGERGAGVPPWLPIECGVNIVRVLEDLAADHDAAAELLQALRSVRADPSLEVTTESRFTADAKERFCEMHIRRLDRPDGGLAVTFHDVTRRRKLEQDHQANLHEIAHLDRVASLGALATSLAHELNQPLTAILTNAQAAQALLENGSVSPNEIGEVLTDIVEDDRRAGDIIYRIRRMLKKGDVQAELVDLNMISVDAIRLVAARASRHRVTIDQLLSQSAVRVSGDSVQLQQVIVNLLLNAIDATAQRVDGPRRVTIATRTSDREAELAVYDTGSGVEPAELARIFRPFFSTKQEGLGMGLSISRTIVEAHRGRIWAENGKDGAVFRLAFARPGEEVA